MGVSILCFMPSFFIVQLLSHVQLSLIPWTAAPQASLSFTISQSLLKLMSIESVMLSNHLILCRPLLLLPSIFPSIRILSNESALHIMWPKYWSWSFSFFFFFTMNMYFSKLKKFKYRDFSGGPMVKTSCFICREHGSILGWGT